MKIARLSITDFRGIQALDLNFTDELGLVKDLVILAGANGRGKTSVLDAISLALGPASRLTTARQDLRIDTRSLVRRGAARARVELTLTAGEDEREAAAAVTLRRTGRMVTAPERWELVWEYPDPKGRQKNGRLDASPEALSILEARWQAIQLFKAGGQDERWFERLGRAALFDQRRTGLGRTLSPETARVLRKGGDPPDRRTRDPKDLILDLAMKAEIKGPRAFKDQWKELCSRYSQISAPHRIVGAQLLPDGEPDLELFDGTHSYGWDGLSSGEVMLLLMLSRFVVDRLHRSIVMIDEVELHLHPTWQRRLLHALPHMGSDNQLILTTHSDYLADVAPSDALYDLGGLIEDGP